jgi:hypothetical protein
MPCGNIGDDDDPKWWDHIDPVEELDDPSSFMYQFSEKLGDGIDIVSDLLVTAAILMSGLPVHLMARLTGHNLAEHATARFD